MDDKQKIFVDMYKKVAIPFLYVAAERDEKLTQEILTNIVIKFIMMNDVMGAEVTEEHLAYELQKYRTDGLRSDYR